MKPRPKPRISTVKDFTKLLVSHKRAPGDVVVLTAMIRDIALTYPDLLIGIDHMSAKAIFQNNPYLRFDKRNRQDVGVYAHMADYGSGMRAQNSETVHFLAYFHRMFTKITGLPLPVWHPWPDLHLSDYESSTSLLNGRYWVLMGGGKIDMPAKVWSTARWQAVVNYLKKYFGIQCVQLGSTSRDCWNPQLENVLDLVGKTSLRDMLQLIKHADGVMCGITAAMHMAAGLKRPCVVVAGGREAWWWEAYVNENTGFGLKANNRFDVPHRYLHTIGQLDCCKTHGCWKSYVHALHRVDKPKAKENICKQPSVELGQPVPQCLQEITVEHVVNSVMSYYEDGTLPWL